MEAASRELSCGPSRSGVAYRVVAQLASNADKQYRSALTRRAACHTLMPWNGERIPGRCSYPHTTQALRVTDIGAESADPMASPCLAPFAASGTFFYPRMLPFKAEHPSSGAALVVRPVTLGTRSGVATRRGEPSGEKTVNIQLTSGRGRWARPSESLQTLASCSQTLRAGPKGSAGTAIDWVPRGRLKCETFLPDSKMSLCRKNRVTNWHWEGFAPWWLNVQSGSREKSPEAAKWTVGTSVPSSQDPT